MVSEADDIILTELGVRDQPDGPAYILVVDDSAAVRASVRDILSRAPVNARVVEARDGSEALKRALSEAFDCIVCDLAMPVMDGMTFLRALRSQKSRVELPVVFLTVREGLGDKLDGFRNGASDFVVKPFEPDELLVRVETHIGLCRAQRRNLALMERLKVLVDTDPLTDIANRRAFMRRLSEEVGRAKRTGKKLGLLLLDADRFKDINDTYGHPAGDAVLVGLAQLLKARARSYDLVARLGGEELAVLLPEITVEGARGAAERLREAIERGPVGAPEGAKVTVSIGVALGPAGDDDDGIALLKRADQALYEAKAAGRNRVAMAR